MNIIKRLSGLSKNKAILVSIFSIVLIIILDYSNGKELSFRILYLIPVTITTWNAGLLWGIIIAVISAASKIYLDYIQGVPYSHIVFYIWEGLIVFGIFSVYVLILSKLKEAMQTLEEKNRQLKEANDLKDEFLSIASHDLKNPLNNILSFGTIIEEEPEIPKKEIKRIGRHIKIISLQMFKLIDNLITSSGIEMQELELHMESVDIVQTASSVLSQYDAVSKRKSIRTNLKSEAPAIFVMTDRNIITQVLDNLISNALKFSPYDRNVWVCISANAKENDRVSIEIRDEGPGIDEEDRIRLFTRFSKLSARPTGNESSTGLGLYIVKKFVDALNGEILCISEKRKGTKFIVQIPVNCEKLSY